MPMDSNLLLPFSSTDSVCNNALERLRVIFILSRPSKPDLRLAIRNTWANLTAFKNSNLAANWTRVFLIGQPSDESEDRALRLENKNFDDLLVVNVSEGYYNSALKMLIAMKFFSCYCRNAEYFIKADDDDYVKLKILDELLITERNSVDKKQAAKGNDTGSSTREFASLLRCRKTGNFTKEYYKTG